MLLSTARLFVAGPILQLHRGPMDSVVFSRWGDSFGCDSELRTDKLGTISLGISYASLTVFSLVASLVVRAVGSRNAILLGTAGYLLFIAAKLKPACANSLSPTLEQVYGKPHVTCLVAKWRVELFFRVVFVSMLVKHSYSGALKYARPPHPATLLGIGNGVLDTAQCTPCFAIQAEHGN
ncbi:hypothetical protein SAY86_020911 [Trapa natans]|uniref:Uncharacterized protein n=1 Tax=Trapa natans TaxID=22666 RepID=A0AAN7M7Q1_TRANT|nr:hypothetical protein SAY86_020911 [Trapa natans]